uniref:Transthyretin n=1 Tax=Panagrolaimus sp. ES5 TaxID=591445 RepID=A0AC34FTP0_9BILA
MKCFILAFVFATLIDLATANLQSIMIQTVVVCGDEHDSHIKVELWDADRTDPDDLMGSTTAEYSLVLFVEGKETEITDIDPELRIFHNCGKSCLQKSTFKLPDSVITQGSIPKLVNIGAIDLKTMPSEDVGNDCT